MEEMQRSYLDYAMSVIVSRALPDVRDGLKPVHRRILYGMTELGIDWNKKYVKCARVTGDVMGKFHPHGNSAIYDALARMAQPWSLRLPLIDGQGNFGSVDGDPPAAERYTECRLQKAAHSLLDDLDKETVDFRDNYDGTLSEPVVVPAKFPNLLVNGAGGIAVGMATNIPPHNLSEVIDGCIALIDDPAIELPELMQIIPGPDFPTGAKILGRAGIRSAYETGRGSVIMRGVAAIEPMRGDREQIIITEIPYQVNKATMIEKMAELVREKRIEGISDLRDESDRQGYRVVVELKRDANADVILNQLYRYTPLQTSFGCNMVALNGGKPEQMTLLDMLRAFVSFREEVVSRRTKYPAAQGARTRPRLGRPRDRRRQYRRSDPRHPPGARSAVGARRADDAPLAGRRCRKPDPADRRSAPSHQRGPDLQSLGRAGARHPRTAPCPPDGARPRRNRRRTQQDRRRDQGLSRYPVVARPHQTIVKDELAAVRDEFGTPRRTEIVDGGLEMDDEDLIAREDMVVTVSHLGYIKRVPLTTYRAQRRGGKGRSGMTTRDEDFVTRLFVVNTHTPVLFFSSRGIVYKEKVWRLPIGTPTSRGKALINMLPLEPGERITTIMPLPEDEDSWDNLDVMFSTTRGTVRRNKLSDFVQVNRNGKIAMKLEEEGDEILSVETCTEHDDVLLTTALGQCIRFSVDDVRVFAGRNSIGVRGITLGEGDRIISMTIVGHVDAEPWERAAYLKRSASRTPRDERRGRGNRAGRRRSHRRGTA